MASRVTISWTSEQSSSRTVREVMQMRCQGAISAVAEIDSNIYQTSLLWKDNGLLQKAYKYTVEPDCPEKKDRRAMSPAKRKGVGKVSVRSWLPRSSD